MHVRRSIFTLFTVVFLSVSGVARAQEIAGRWQGTLDMGKDKLRVVLEIEKGDGSALKGQVYSIDQSPTPAPVTTLSLTGSMLKFTVDAYHASYEGTFNPDGNTITGNMTQGATKPLNFERATKETAWVVDPSPHKAQFIPV
ncbi:MAG TPA: hypothetical protein VK596_02640, partial [Edaphobacter sp.]|nr:hypothetical protein [Edaphobacter sp.]